ncbi:MAG: TM2 domain-containing protein, partial [Sphingomonadaceae bacterium]|nr:TM2 domain-containing protein [Sphingomonadaceae bacterium]
MAIDRYSPNEVGPPLASTAITYLVWFFLGNIGCHRFLTGRVGTGLMM